MIQSLISALIAVNILAYIMVILRPKIYGTKLYTPMLTNIKLSIWPICVLMAVMTAIIILQALNTYFTGYDIWWWLLSFIIGILGFMVWVLLLPNSGYLITELNFNHRESDTAEVPLWYDIVAVLTLAMSGVMNMCFNVFMIQFITGLLFQGLSQNITFLFNTIPWIITCILMILASFGIYLGRYIRFNSWDVKHPIKFMKKLRDHFKEKGYIKNCLLFVLFHSLFFIIFYRATVGVVLEELLSAINFPA